MRYFDGWANNTRKVHTYTKIAGKSQFCSVQRQSGLFAYSVWQKDFATANIHNVEYIRGIGEFLEDDGFFYPNTPTLLVFDDVLDEVCESNKAAASFTKDVHHKNDTVLCFLQNLFKHGRVIRDTTLNSQYIILLKSAPDT